MSDTIHHGVRRRQDHGADETARTFAKLFKPVSKRSRDIPQSAQLTRRK